MSALKFLLAKEWSMGNGQCPECCGVPEDWIGHPCHLDSTKIGHEPDCELAAAIKDAGGAPLMMGESKRADTYRIATSPQGFLVTEPVTQKLIKPAEESKH